MNVVRIHINTKNIKFLLLEKNVTICKVQISGFFVKLTKPVGKI